MSLGGKLLLILVGVIIVVGGGFIAYDKLTDMWTAVLKKDLKEAIAKAEKLKEEVTANEAAWNKRERDYEAKIKALNTRVATLKKERDGYEDRIKKLQAARESVKVPDNPDDICGEFAAAGIRSCTRTKANK